jgi:D-sedoheptulose 7-phosphate isomerase
MNEQQPFQIKRILFEYRDAFTKLLNEVDVGTIQRILQHLDDARRKGAMIYVAGNGGSAATASHWVNDLGKATKRSGQAPIRVMSLSDNVSWLTALANDEGYERVFAGQLENFAQPGDVLVVISASGNSQNLVQAVELAKSRGATTIAFVGFDGGVLKDMVHDYFWFPTSKGAYGIVESGHALLCHILTTCLAEISDGAQGVGSYAPADGTQLLQNKESFGRGA